MKLAAINKAEFQCVGPNCEQCSTAITEEQLSKLINDSVSKALQE